ncbi:helix-turn-helix domain-containing protein [Lactobacillus sp. ESL0228]|uniref:helix-turn-helix domain-containing protein n=1 Tax=Lactobacillus sp. ESL0228 TaxID=2069352 RepID=UPI001313E1C0|nr:helix-turn-helix domain-containing protein [Lactobacillus sp. ESL0228]
MKNRIKELRQIKKVSQGDLAKAIGLTHQAISQYESEKRNPNDKVWQKLADYFEVSVSYIKGEIDTELLEKLIELTIFFCFPKITLTYGDEEIDDEFKPFIVIDILSQILSLLGYDSKDKFQMVYRKSIHMADDQITSGFLNNFKCVVDETIPDAEGITNNLLQAYEKL